LGFSEDLDEPEAGADEHRHRRGEVQDAAAARDAVGVHLTTGTRLFPRCLYAVW
jgi:hypothetical protein